MSRNKFLEQDGYVIGTTTKGQEFFFDTQYLDLLSQCTWSVGNHGYLQGQLNGKMCLMHRVITNCPSGLQVDHINHNKLDNRLKNLRICTASNNQMNEKLSKNNTSGTKGVSYYKRSNMWESYISVANKRIRIGKFLSYEEAVKARKSAEEKMHGEFAYKEEC